MISSNQVIKIDNKEQFKNFYSFMRSYKNGITFEEWDKKYGISKYPVYLGLLNSVTFGSSLGMTSNIDDKEIISVEEANKLI